ncbi:MAG TPA: hypothetical protein VNB23_05635 [Ramlibacter sp.]|nr:hypothetical protein [Ramlibacter sp.]
MRFSSIFQLPAVPAQPAQVDAGSRAPLAPEQPLAAGPGVDLPDDLDARVRLIGEWQLGEG